MTTGIKKKIERVKRSLDRIERGAWSELTLSECADYIAWLAKFKKVPPEVWAPLCDQATRLFKEVKQFESIRR